MSDKLLQLTEEIRKWTNIRDTYLEQLQRYHTTAINRSDFFSNNGTPAWVYVTYIDTLLTRLDKDDTELRASMRDSEWESYLDRVHAPHQSRSSHTCLTPSR